MIQTFVMWLNMICTK